MTWKDYFDQMAVSQLTEVKAIGDDAAAQGFTYDDTQWIWQPLKLNLRHRRKRNP